MMNAAQPEPSALRRPTPLTQDVRICGSPKVTLKAAFSKRANFSAALVSLPTTGTGTVITRGWIDPENPVSDSVTVPTVPGDSAASPSTCRPRTRSSRPAAGSA